MSEKTKPSEFKGFPWNSALGKCEPEIVARNIMTILKRTGDTFRPLTHKEYIAERKKDGSFTNAEIDSFDKVIKYFKSPDTVALFSPQWA